MLDALKSLFENNVVSKEIRAEIENAWNAKINENKLAATAELREEFAKKYAHDKQQLIDAVDKLVSEKLAVEIAEFAEDRNQLAEAKAQYAVAIRENTDALKSFVFERLAAEIEELHADQKVVSENFSKLEEFVVEALSKEIAEFHQDKQDLAETKVRLIREAKAHFEKVRKNFIEKSSAVVTETVSKVLTKEIGQLKGDIESARKNDFGRRLFETFSEEYASSYLNEKSETSKLLKVVKIKDQQIEDAKKAAQENAKLVEAKDAEIKSAKDAAERSAVIGELTAPLNTEQKEIMKNLLESVQTAKLRSAFDKYMPSVINGGAVPAKKQALKEGTEITGDKTQTNVRQVFDSNIFAIRRLAGL
jgi:hypothetical protein